MENMRNTCLLFLFVCCPIFVTAQTTEQSIEEERLLDIMKGQEGEERFFTIFDLALLYDGEERMLHYIDMMEDYARETNNNHFIGSALLLRATYYANWGTMDDFLYHADISQKFSISQKDLEAYFAIETNVVQRYIAEGKFETALRVVDEMLKIAGRQDAVYGELSAYLSMGDIYMAGKYYDKALEAYDKSYTLLDKWQRKDKNIHRLEIGLSFIRAAYHSKNYDKALSLCNELIAFGEAFEEDNDIKLQYRDYERLLYAYRAALFIQKGDMPQAWESLKMTETFNYNLEMLGQTVNLVYAMYYNKTGEYDKALEHLDQAVGILTDTNMIIDVIEIKELKAEILANMGKHQKAYLEMREAVDMTDSLATKRLATQISELRTIYQLDRITAEKERQRIIMLSAIGGCLLLAVLVVVFIVYSRKLYRKNLSLYQQINERNRSEKEAEEAEAHIPPEQLSREKKLFLELQRLMQSEKLFTMSNLDRNTLAEMLGTNRQYLTDAITKETGLTFSLYIAELRLKYALELLSTRPDLTLEAVALDSGHGSYSPFYRAFTQKYGMNPSEYRRFAANKNISATLQ